MTAEKITNLNEAQAIKTAQEIVRLEAVIKKKKDDLKSYVEENGTLIAGGKIWSISESESVKLTAVQKQAVATALAMDGVNAWDYLSISATDLKKCGWNTERIKQYGTVSYTSRFSSKNEK